MTYMTLYIYILGWKLLNNLTSVLCICKSDNPDGVDSCTVSSWFCWGGSFPFFDSLCELACKE